MASPLLVQKMLLMEEKLRRTAVVDLHTFLVHFAWPVLRPGVKFEDNWHIHAICEHLEAVYDGEITRLLINMPFRLLKSTIISQAYPAWEWLRKPELQYLTAAYAKEVATRDAVDSRRVIESAKYQLAWGDRFKLTSDQNVKTRFENNMKGSRVVTATDAAGTGFGGDRIIVDDPISALQADSPQARKQAIEWWKGTATTRLNDQRTGAMIAVHQRMNVADLTGYILAEEAGEGWQHLVLPMRFDPALRKTTSIGFADPRTEKGELLFPDRLDEKTVRSMERRLGAYHKDAQLQQNPSARAGAIFKQADWKFYSVRPEDIAGDMDEIVWSWDCAFKDLDTNDYVAGWCIGRKGANKYMLARVCERLSFSKTVAEVKRHAEMRPFRQRTIAVLVEDKANGPAVVDTLKSTVPGLIAVTPQGGKVARANACQPQHEAGNFYLPSPALDGFEWVTDLVAEFAKFPGVDHDDDVDAFTQGVIWFNSREGYELPGEAPATGGDRTFK